MNLIKKLTMTILAASVLTNSTACSNSEPTNKSLLLNELENDAEEYFTSLVSFKIKTTDDKDLLIVKCEEHHAAVYTRMYNGFASQPMLLRPSRDDEFVLTYEFNDEELENLPFEKNKEIRFGSLTDEEYLLLLDLVKNPQPLSVKEL